MYCKIKLLEEIKTKLKVKETIIPEGYTGRDFTKWSNEVLGKEQKPPKRKVSEQY